MQIFIDMKKPKHLSIRLSVEQFKKLADNLVIEQKSKSLLMREILEDYLDGNKRDINKQNKKNNKNPKTF
jgi:predicted DNA-binding protein